MLQTILGSGGAIGIPLARELKNYTDKIRLVSRNPKKVNDNDELFPVDVNDLNQIDKAVEGSEVVYMTIGFEYKLKVWRKTWPLFMQQVIDSCKKHQSKMVFFDNIYMYARTAVPFMTEDSLIDPPSEKGKVRKQIREMIINEVEKKNLLGLISRAFGNIKKIHTFTYTPDAAKATAILGNTPDAFNQEWHVPTTKEKLTALDWIELIAKELSKEPKVQVVPKWMIQILGIFVPVMREFPEMLYQYDQDYIFDSSKFEKRFGIIATSPEEGIKRTLERVPSL
jgi:nucleoside-diphosphate-sugar epimerase